MALCVRAMLALMLSLSPLAAASAAPMDSAMAACGMMDDGDCCTVACAMAGGCMIPPMPPTALEPITYRPGIHAPPTTSGGAGLLSGPEPPPPRAGVA